MKDAISTSLESVPPSIAWPSPWSILTKPVAEDIHAKPEAVSKLLRFSRGGAQAQAVDSIPDTLPDANAPAILLFSPDRSVFHSLDEGLGALLGSNNDFDWISSEQFDLTSVLKTGYDLFFIDIRFGKHAGVEKQLRFIEQLAAHPDTPPIILVSDKHELRFTLLALEAGGSDYLFRDELQGAVLRRMFSYCSTQTRPELNCLFERRSTPNASSIHSALEYSLLEEAEGGTADAGDFNALVGNFYGIRTRHRKKATSTLELLPIPAFTVNSRFQLTAINPQLATVLSKNIRDCIGRSLSAVGILSIEQLATLEAELQKAPAVEQTTSTRVVITTTEGRRWFDIRLSRYMPGEYIGFLHDVTSYMRAQLALQQSESRLRKILEHLPVSVWTLDNDLRLNIGNSSNWIPESIIRSRPQGALTLYDLFETDDPNFRPIALARKALRGESSSLQLTIGDTEYIVLMDPYRDSNGRILGAVGVSVNISERLELEDKLRQSDKVESLAMLARGIAHDFNNLLLSIIGNAGLIALELPEASPARERLRKITKAADCASDFTAQLLAYAGKADTTQEPVEINALCREMIDVLEDTLPADCELTTSLENALPAILGDLNQVRQLIMNLLTNASDALGARQGAIHIQTSRCSKRALPLNLRKSSESANEEFVCLSVRDSGCGMDEKTRRRIFDPFFTTKAAGRGLGLATVIGIVKSHNALIDVKSVPNEGTTFRVFFHIRK